MSESKALTKEEQEVYDRQLRMWGVAAQQRMRNSRVLVVGMKATSAEICKNLVLTGIGSLVVLDDKIVVPRDLPGQFFLTQASIGQPVAQASLQAIQALNPHVTVTADVAKIEDKPDEFFLSFDVVLLTEATRAQQVCIFFSLSLSLSLSIYLRFTVLLFLLSLSLKSRLLRLRVYSYLSSHVELNISCYIVLCCHIIYIYIYI